MSNVAKLAAGLSEPMKRALVALRTPDSGLVSTVAQIGLPSFRALERRGLVQHVILGMVSCARPTSTGLAVRQYLTENPA